MDDEIDFYSEGNRGSGEEIGVFKIPRMFISFVVKRKLHGLLWSVRNSSELAPATQDLAPHPAGHEAEKKVLQHSSAPLS